MTSARIDVQRIRDLVDGIYACVEPDPPSEGAIIAARHLALEASEALDQIHRAELAEMARAARSAGGAQ